MRTDTIEFAELFDSLEDGSSERLQDTIDSSLEDFCNSCDMFNPISLRTDE